MKIEIGYRYVNHWNEIRIPIKFDDMDSDSIIYIEKFGQVYVYNPYKNKIKISNMKNWKKTEYEKLSDLQISNIEKEIINIDTEWNNLLRNGIVNISNIIFKS